MKRLIFIPLLIFGITLSAQFTKSGGTFLKMGNTFVTEIVAGYDYNPEYDTVLAAFATSPHDTIKLKQELLVDSLTASGFWARMDFLYILAGHSEAGAKINWIHPGTNDLTDPGSTAPVFTAFEGFQGNGSDYLSTNYNPTTDSVNFGRRSCSIFSYGRDSIGGSYASLGVRDAGGFIRILPKTATGGCWSYINDLQYLNTANTDTRGLIIGTRRSGTDVENYMNGSSLGSGSSAVDAVPNGDIFILSYNYVGTGSTFPTTQQLSVVGLMNGITTLEQARLNNMIETYMDSLGTGVEP